MNLVKKNIERRTKIHALVLIFLFGSYVIYAQDQKSLRFILHPTISKEKYDLTTDSANVLKSIQKVLSEIRSEGFLTAKVDTILRSETELSVHISTGERYKWLKLSVNDIDPTLIRRLGYDGKLYKNRPFGYKQLRSLYKYMILYSENNGYPFASVSLDSVQIEGDQISARLNYDSGPLIVFDSLLLLGSTKTNRNFLESYLKVSQGEPYSERNVRRIGDRLKRLQFLDLTDSSHLSFQSKMARITLGVKDKKVNSFDGIIGFLPNEENDGKLLVTGQANMKLHNLFGAGQYLNLEWQRLRTESQLLDVTYQHPNLFRSPLGFEGQFYLLKEDSTFINRKARLEFQYLSGSYSKFRFFWEISNSNILSTNQFKNSSELPDFADFELNTYGIGYNWANFNQTSPLTKSGYSTGINIGIGNKKIQTNSAFDPEVYQGVEFQSVQYVLELSLDKYTPLAKQWVLKSRIEAGTKINNRLFFNDLYRLGGLNSIRGFNENSLFAADYGLFSNELRLQFDKSSFLMVFYDQAYTNYKLELNKKQDYPAGFGTGISFATGSGVFSLVYALGRTNDQPFSFNLSKIHFGIISRF